MELPSAKVGAHIRPWHKFTTRRPHRPLETVPIVGQDAKLEWCRFCKLEVSTKEEQAMNRGLYVYRKNCLRCGQVMAYGIAKSNINKPGPLDPAVKEFIQATTRNRS